MPGGYGATSSAQTRPTVRPSGSGSAAAKKSLPGWPRLDRFDLVRGGPEHRPRRAAVTVHRGGQGGGEAGQGRTGVGERDDGDQDVPVGGLDRQAAGQQVPLDQVAVGAGAEEQQRQVERVDRGAVQDGEAVHVAERSSGRPRRDFDQPAGRQAWGAAGGPYFCRSLTRSAGLSTQFST